MSKVLNFYHIGKVIPPNAVYMGRAMPHLGLEQSKFANPYKISDDEPRNVVIERYRLWLWDQIQSGLITSKELLALDGKDLVCFCKQPNKEVLCHCDVILSAIGWAKEKHNEKVKIFLKKESEDFDKWVRCDEWDFCSIERRAAWAAWKGRALKSYKENENNE